MKKIVVIGATGTLGQAVTAELKARHEVIEVGATRGQYQRTAPIRRASSGSSANSARWMASSPQRANCISARSSK